MMRRRGVHTHTFLFLLTIFSPFFVMGLISLPEGEVIKVPASSLLKKNTATNLMEQAFLLNKEDKHKEAIALLTKAIKDKKDDPLFKTLLVQTFDLFLQDEIRFGKNAMEKNPKNKQAYIRMSRAFALLDNEFKAMEVLLNGITHNVDSADLWMEIAKLELKKDRDLEALDVFKEVIRLDKNNSDALNNAAFLLQQQKEVSVNDLKVAEKYAKSARTIDPKNPEYIDTLALIQNKKGNKTIAISLMKEAIKLAPNEGVFKNRLKAFHKKELIKASE